MITSEQPVSDADVSSGSTDVEPGADLRFDFYEEVSGTFGTPFYLYDVEKIESQVFSLRSLFPSAAKPRLLYSFKANPLPSVAAEMRRGGCVADLTSQGEVAAAREADFDLSTALYGGPGKSEQELAFAIASGVRNFSVESEHDLTHLAAAASTAGVRVRAILRINPLEAPKAKLAMSGVASQFGFEEAELRENGRRIVGRAGESVFIAGIHIYWGTQIGDVDALMECFTQTVRIGEELSVQLGFPLEILNLGGGFPWPYSHVGEGPDLSTLRDRLARLHAESGAAKTAEWWFESGRYLAASSGTLVARVMDIKLSKDDKRFLILDTGIHHLGGMAGLGRIPRFSIDLETNGAAPDGAAPDSEEISVDVVGPLCTPLDCIGRRISLQEPKVGDLVAVSNVGAYGPTASVSNFLSRPAPAEVMHRGSEILSAHCLKGGHTRLR